MEIKTKYHTWSTVYIMKDNKIKELYISWITVRVHRNMYYCDETTILYHFESETSDSEINTLTEENIAGTKQELLDSL